jgi:hypothetical protein
MGREDEIRTIAYRIWEEEGCCNGHDFNHWLKAEVIWEDKQKDVAASVVTKAKSKQTTEQGEKGRPAFSRGADSTPEEPHGIHHSLILKVLGR